MRPRERRDSGQSDLFKARLDRIIDLRHELALLALAIDWAFLEASFGAVYSPVPGQPPLPVRLMAGLAILKSMYNLSDEELTGRWVENPYFQYFCGEEFFQHKASFDRSSMTRWRRRMGEDRLNALVQESLAAAVKTKAMPAFRFCQVIVDTTVQEKAVAFPTDAKLAHRARERLVRLAKKYRVRFRQSYARVGKFALIKHQRYAHARQFKRAGRSRTLKLSWARHARHRARDRAAAALQALPARALSRRPRADPETRHNGGARFTPSMRPRWSASARARPTSPTSSASKSARNHAQSPGGQFVLHAKALPGNPYDGHTLATVIPAIEKTTGATLARILADAGYRGHNAPPSHKIGLYPRTETRRDRCHQKDYEAPRRSVEPVIGHMKQDHRMGRNYLAGSQAMPATPCSQQQATTSGASSTGWLSCCP